MYKAINANLLIDQFKSRLRFTRYVKNFIQNMFKISFEKQFI